MPIMTEPSDKPTIEAQNGEGAAAPKKRTMSLEARRKISETLKARRAAKAEAAGETLPKAEETPVEETSTPPAAVSGSRNEPAPIAENVAAPVPEQPVAPKTEVPAPAPAAPPVDDRPPIKSSIDALESLRAAAAAARPYEPKPRITAESTASTLESLRAITRIARPSSPMPEQLGEELPPVGDDYVPEYAEGIVEVSGKGFGFLRDQKRGFVQNPADVFVTPEIVRQYNLRDGQWVKGEVRRGNRGAQLFRLSEINGETPDKAQNTPAFEELTVVSPDQRIHLETTPDRYTTRIMDMMTPIGKGQRGLIVAPPRTGKTTLLQHIADAVAKNHPEIKLIILLVDERPEELTEIRRNCPQAEVMASTNDSDIKSHTRIAQLAIERAKRLVEQGQDVFVLLDSITRVGRAFNNAMGGGGRTMSGGIDARALEIPRKLFASARNTEEAGSLTIIATAL